MKRVLLNLLIGLLPGLGLLPATALAADPPQAAQPRGEATLLRVEQRRKSDGDPMVTSVGLFGLSRDKMAHIDISYIEPGELAAIPAIGGGNTWALEVGAGYLVPTKVPVFFGVAWVAGLNRGDFSSTYYPEVGAMFQVGQGVLLSVSRRRYMKLMGELQDVVMFGIALTY